MEVALSGRMGGPEVGVAYLAEVVRVQPKLQAALAGVLVPGLEAIDIELWIGGSITDYCSSGFSSDAKYFPKKQKITVSICVPRDDAADMKERPDLAVPSWLADGLSSVTLPKSAQSLEFSSVSGAAKTALDLDR